jgi:hypothetical protein
VTTAATSRARRRAQGAHVSSFSMIRRGLAKSRLMESGEAGGVRGRAIWGVNDSSFILTGVDIGVNQVFKCTTT